MSSSPSSYSSIHLLSWHVWFICLTTKRNEQIAQKKKESYTVGSRPRASEVWCLFWSHLKAATRKEADIKPSSLSLSSSLLAILLSLLSPSHTPTGDSRQCRAHQSEGTRTTLKTASAQQQIQQARKSVCHVFNYACCTALHSPASQEKLRLLCRFCSSPLLVS